MSNLHLEVKCLNLVSYLFKQKRNVFGNINKLVQSLFYLQGSCTITREYVMITRSFKENDFLPYYKFIKKKKKLFMDSLFL